MQSESEAIEWGMRNKMWFFSPFSMAVVLMVEQFHIHVNMKAIFTSRFSLKLYNSFKRWVSYVAVPTHKQKMKSMDPPKAFSLRHRVMMTSSGKADKRATRTQTHSDTHRAAFNHEASCVYKNSLSCYIGPCVALNLIQDNLQILSFSYYCQDMNLTKLTKIIFISNPMF